MEGFRTSKFWDYFNLNAREARGKRLGTAGGENGTPAKDQMGKVEQIAMYVGLLIGVLASGAVLKYAEGHGPVLDLNWGVVVISTIIALILAPAVYQRLGTQKSSPFVVRFGLYAQQGIFWQMALASLGKAAGVS